MEELKKELKVSREESAFFQISRDTLEGLYSASKKREKELEAKNRCLQLQLESLLEKHEVAIKVYQQRLKDLMFGHKIETTRLRTEKEKALQADRDIHAADMGVILEEKKALRATIREKESTSQEQLRTQQQEQAKTISLLRSQYERELRDAQESFGQKTKELREELEIKRRADIREVEEGKNAHIAKLMAEHDKAFEEMKKYYNDITHNNLDLIRSLKEELDEMRKREAENERLMFEISQENRRMSEPLQKALKEVSDLRRQLVDYEKDKQSLKAAKTRVSTLEMQLKSASWEQEVIRGKFDKLKGERDELHDKFSDAVLEAEHRSVFREQLLERRLQAASDELEKKDAQLTEVISMGSHDPGDLKSKRQQIEDILDGKNRGIRQLQFELARVTKLYNEALATFHERLREHGIATEELMFRPLEMR
ncbi:Dynein regulatory complex subunit 4 [Aduncisulcus paluster]|uniref:Dynein regulatory complex subunit 4 n=1 Tax=Aduncisulcus paluster TaxID=2918883 RepID=A0ABQ5K7F8_9EUKA|nr:Dynein regulatory complex subunit 4 [Aduncisulcus paluster]